MDIVERLKSWADPDDKAYVRDTDDMALEAAHEIEMLRGAVKTLVAILRGIERAAGTNADATARGFPWMKEK